MSWLVSLLAPSMFLVLAGVFVPLERLFPLRAEQGTFRPYWWNDALYYVFNRHIIIAGLGVVLVGAVTIGEVVLPDSVRSSVAGLPIVVQLALSIVLGDFAFYLIHRAFHRFDFLWQFHAVHHSLTEMDWLASMRIHAVDQIAVRGVSLIPLYVLDFSETTRWISVTLFMFQSHFIHANTRISLGPLKYVLAGPEFHHWHHSSAPEDWDTNFAGQLPVFDWLFGTLRMPAGRTPVAYGAGDPVPKTWLPQLVYPFLRLLRMARGQLTDRSGA